MKLDMADYVCREKEMVTNPCGIKENKEHWKESVQMLKSNNLFRGSSIEINDIWEPLIKKGH